MARIGWIDFSTNDRNKVTRLLHLLQPEGQLDELGIGRIRDGLSDELFPGISTIQTRAKYFFIISYIIRDYYRASLHWKEMPSAKTFLNENEHKVKNKLKDMYGGQSGTGIIGITLPAGKMIVRQPSEIYWVGLQTFNFIDTQGLSLSPFLRRMQSQASSNLVLWNGETQDDDDYDAGIGAADPVKIPVCNGWYDSLSIALTPEESSFFTSAIRQSPEPQLKRSLLRKLFDDPALLQVFVKAGNFPEFVRKAASVSAPSHTVILAHDFSQVIEGAHLLYNHMLQERFYPDQHKGAFLVQFKEWYAMLPQEMLDYSSFSAAKLSQWAGPSALFVNRWWQELQSAGALTDAKLARLQTLVRQQEIAAKGKKSRLHGSLQSNFDLKINKRIGLKRLEFRFHNIKRIIDDIINNSPDA